MSPEDFVRVTSTSAAQIFNVFPRKGVVSVGSDADVIVLDPNLEHIISASTHHSQMDTNVYEGKRIKGKVCFCNHSSCSQHCLLRWRLTNMAMDASAYQYLYFVASYRECYISLVGPTLSVQDAASDFQMCQHKLRCSFHVVLTGHRCA